MYLLRKNEETLSWLVKDLRKEAEKAETDEEKENLKQKIITFQKNVPHKCTTHPHPFFGKLTSKQLLIMMNFLNNN